MKWLLVLLALGTAQAEVPASYQVGHLLMTRVRAPPTPPNATVAAVYLWITNSGSHADRLAALSTPIAASAEIHLSTMRQGVMRMSPVGALELPAGATVKIEPGALHIMLQGLKQPLQPGSVFPLTLRFRDAGMLVVQVPVTALE